jgi:hypothetical protein
MANKLNRLSPRRRELRAAHWALQKAWRENYIRPDRQRDFHLLCKRLIFRELKEPEAKQP